MFNLKEWIFGPKKESEANKFKYKMNEVFIGKEYFIDYKNKNNPFADDFIAYVTVLNVKDGWVQYKCGGKKHNSIFDPSSKRIEDFTRIFKISPEQNV